MEFTAPATLTEGQREIWAKAAAQLGGQRERDLAWISQLRRDLEAHPGYFAAALARAGELRAKYQDRPHWCWAAERWETLMQDGGCAAVLRLLEDPVTHQELLSTSPFAVMRPPLPENKFYSSHVRS
jgi:hypothetical protein